MPEYELIDGPCHGKLQLAEGQLQDYIAFPLDKAGKVLLDKDPRVSQLAFYRRDAAEGSRRYHFDVIRRLRVLRGGAMNGTVEPRAGDPPFVVEGACAEYGTTTQWFVTYQRSGEDELGRVTYDLREQVEVESDEGRAIGAIQQFYVNPDYSIYSIKPGHHREVIVEEAGRRASMDEGLVELIKGVWRMGWHTIGSCQERPAGETRAGKAYVAFPFVRHGRGFMEILEGAGIPCQHKETPFRFAQRNQAGESINRMEIPGLTVFFEPADIDRIVAALDGRTRWNGD